jgi:branched-subunit amino acid transport protein
MNGLWIATLGASALCYAIKLLGFSLPESWLSRPRIQRINELIPVVLLSALVAVQTLARDGAIVLDHRLFGLGAAAVALKLRLSFPIVMLSGAIVSAIVYRISI